MPPSSASDTASRAALAARGLSHSFGERAVLSGVSFAVEAGEVVAVTGPSGSGKSTLLHLLAGLDVPQQGEVWWNGHRTDTLSSEDRARLRAGSVGLVFQHHHLLEDLTLSENLAVPLLLAGENPDEAHLRDLLGSVGLAGRENDAVGVLSGGEQQRLAIARALASRPAVVLADEPTGSLDQPNARAVSALMFELARNHNSALLIVTHDENLARSTDRQLHLRDGILAES